MYNRNNCHNIIFSRDSLSQSLQNIVFKYLAPQAFLSWLSKLNSNYPYVRWRHLPPNASAYMRVLPSCAVLLEVAAWWKSFKICIEKLLKKKLPKLSKWLKLIRVVVVEVEDLGSGKLNSGQKKFGLGWFCLVYRRRLHLLGFSWTFGIWTLGRTNR